MATQKSERARGKRVPAALLALVLLTGTGMPASAEMYKYQKDGVWHYTDTPPSDTPAAPKKVEGSAPDEPSGAPPPLEGAPLLAAYPARNAIERAAAATVAVQSPWGFGSGFFISTQGHILTNKHVLRSMEQNSAETEARFREMEGRIGEINRRVAEEEARLRLFKERVEQMRSAAEAEDQPQRRKNMRAEYEAAVGRYQSWRAEFEQRLKSYAKEKQAFQEGRHEYAYSKSVADLAQSFTIILSDSTELYARLVRVSTAHDLALLKLDGYRTPALVPGQSRRLARSEPLYAIGSPARLQNSVTSGIFSGFQQGFLQTNAQIYPGNSGGPLVSNEGQVLGINTFKTLTHKFEGLGFAIPIETALAEFQAELP